MKKVIDISQFQTNVNYAAAAKEFDAAIIRVGYRGYGSAGTLCKDVQLDNHTRGMINNKKPYGFYFFTQATNAQEAVAEANYLHSMIKDYNPTYPIYIDIEESTAPNKDGRADSNTTATWTEVAVAFCERIKELGYTPGVYMSEYWFNNKIDFDKIKKYSIWCAKYGTNDGTAQSKPTLNTYDGWQFTSVYKVNGFANGIDFSYFYKEFDDTAAQPKEEPKKEVTYSTYYVNCEDGLNYRRTPNGELIGTLEYKSKVEIINNSETETNGLIWVKTKSGVYVAKKYLSSKPIIDTYSTYYVNSKDGLNYRATPNGTWNGILKHGEKVEVVNGTETNIKGLIWVKLKSNNNWVAKRFLSETKPEIIEYYREGQNYTLQYNMKVRVSPSVNAKQKLYKDLTPDGQRHAYNQFYAVLKTGTVITAMEVIKFGNEIWLRCPSGYVCAKSGIYTYIK